MSPEIKKNSAGLTAEQMKKLSAPFDEKTLAVKAQAFNKEKTKVMLVPYVPHQDVYRRIEEIDLNWSSEVTSHQIVGEVVYARVKLTICGVTRENSGDGNDLKWAVSDAHKRAAMLFGVARYLYDAEGAWVPYDRDNDYYRVWTHKDYSSGLRASHQPALPMAPAQTTPKPDPAIIAPRGFGTSARRKTMPELEKEVFEAAATLNLSRDQLFEFAQDNLQKPVDKMTIVDMEKLLELILFEVGRS